MGRRPRLDLDHRRPVWSAMSELYRDNELAEFELQGIASSLRQSPYTTVELDWIMFYEVYPVLIFNLWSVTGLWAGFDPDWLEQAISTRANRRLKWPARFIPGKSLVRNEWATVLRLVGQGPVRETL